MRKGRTGEARGRRQAETRREHGQQRQVEVTTQTTQIRERRGRGQWPKEVGADAAGNCGKRETASERAKKTERKRGACIEKNKTINMKRRVLEGKALACGRKNNGESREETQSSGKAGSVRVGNAKEMVKEHLFSKVDAGIWARGEKRRRVCTAGGGDKEKNAERKSRSGGQGVEWSW